MLRKGIILTAGLFLLVNEKKNDLENWERLTLWLGLLFGGLSFILQMKLFDHHEYVFWVFAFFLFSLEAAKAMRTYGWQHFAGLVVIAVSVFYVVPEHTFRIAAVDSFNEQPDALKSDLLRLGGQNLQRQVLCLDMVDGCFSTLYHLRLLPNTGFMGDYMFFGAVGSPPLPYYRQELWDDLHKNPPKVIVLTNMWLNVEGPPRFEKLNQWPELADYLSTNYTLDVTRIFGKQGYRIYLQNDK
jgi:hypothetical protein